VFVTAGSARRIGRAGKAEDLPLVTSGRGNAPYDVRCAALGFYVGCYACRS
jgi:hypothetical protein